MKSGLTGLQSRDLFHYKPVTEPLKVLHIYNKCCENTKKLLVYVNVCLRGVPHSMVTGELETHTSTLTGVHVG